VASFTGRKDILDKMRGYFDSDVGSTFQRIFVLYGLGGAGKSQLAFKFIEESKDKRYASRPNKVKDDSKFTEHSILLVSPISSMLTPRVKRLLQRISRRSLQEMPREP